MNDPLNNSGTISDRDVNAAMAAIFAEEQATEAQPKLGSYQRSAPVLPHTDPEGEPTDREWSDFMARTFG